MIYTVGYLEDLKNEFIAQCKTFANKIDYDGEEAIITVQVDDDYYEFGVSGSIENLNEDRDTNSVSYKATVVCVKIPNVHNIFLEQHMIMNFLNEVIYQD